MNILVVGLGLIGGSICKALKKYTTHFVAGSDINKDIEFAALRDVAMDEAFTGDYSGFDLIIMALFPDATEAYLRENISKMPKTALLTDVCGIKGDFSCRLRDLAEETDQVWDSFLNITKQITEIMGGRSFDGETFRDLLETGMADAVTCRLLEEEQEPVQKPFLRC